jgi:hypothetical protein
MHKLKRTSNSKTSLLPDGYIAIFCGSTDRALTLPPVGALVWEFCDGELSTQDIVGEVAKLIGSEATPELRRQIQDLTNELEKNGFLEKCK